MDPFRWIKVHSRLQGLGECNKSIVIIIPEAQGDLFCYISLGAKYISTLTGTPKIGAKERMDTTFWNKAFWDHLGEKREL